MTRSCAVCPAVRYFSENHLFHVFCLTRPWLKPLQTASRLPADKDQHGSTAAEAHVVCRENLKEKQQQVIADIVRRPWLAISLCAPSHFSADLLPRGRLYVTRASMASTTGEMRGLNTCLSLLHSIFTRLVISQVHAMCYSQATALESASGTE